MKHGKSVIARLEASLQKHAGLFLAALFLLAWAADWIIFILTRKP